MTTYAEGWWEPTGQGVVQLAELGLAFLLCAVIGLERELRQRSAGLRTHTLVGLGAALFVLVSKYGFTNVLGDHVTLDPSRVAAQIVSGIGFVGAGLIFVRRDAVRGLTTAASIWLACAVGTAAGAGLPLLAAAVTAAHFLVLYGLSPLARRLPGSKHAVHDLRLTYVGGRGALRRVLQVCTDRGFTVVELASSTVVPAARGADDEPDGDRARGTGAADPAEPADPEEAGVDGPDAPAGPAVRTAEPERVSLVLRLRGTGSLAELVGDVDDVAGVIGVRTGAGRPEE